MLEEIVIPRLIETKENLAELPRGSQIQAGFAVGYFFGWVVYEGIINKKYAFLTRKKDTDNLISLRSTRTKLFIEDGAIILNASDCAKYSMIYKPNTVKYSEKLKLLENAGL